jgi:hypothetical protein
MCLSPCAHFHTLHHHTFLPAICGAMYTAPPSTASANQVPFRSYPVALPLDTIKLPTAAPPDPSQRKNSLRMRCAVWAKLMTLFCCDTAELYIPCVPVASSTCSSFYNPVTPADDCVDTRRTASRCCNASSCHMQVSS